MAKQSRLKYADLLAGVDGSPASLGGHAWSALHASADRGLGSASLSGCLPTPVDPETLAVAKDVDAQWELFLANTYTLAGLQGLDFSTVELPFDWFETWLLELGG